MKKNIVKLEWYDPTMVLSVPGEEADCIVYKAYGELEIYKNFYFLYMAEPEPRMTEGTKCVSFIIPKGSVKSITKLEEHNATANSK